MFEWIALFVLGFIVAAWNSSVGPTGGALIAGTSLITPPPGSLLLQGIAAIFSNGFRSWKMKDHLDKQIIIPFVLGSLLSVLPAYFLFSKIESNAWMVIIGIYCIAAALLSFFEKKWGLPLFPAGFLSGVASFLAGSGSLVAAPSIRRYTKDKYSLISNEALAVFLQGVMKTFVLVLIFSFSFDFFFLLSALLISMVLGNLIGLRILQKIPDKAQGKIQMISVIFLGSALLVQGALDFFS